MKSTVVENAETPDYIPVKRRRNFPYPSSTRDNNVERDNSFTSYKEIGSSLISNRWREVENHKPALILRK